MIIQITSPVIAVMGVIDLLITSISIINKKRQVSGSLIISYGFLLAFIISYACMQFEYIDIGGNGDGGLGVIEPTILIGGLSFIYIILRFKAISPKGEDAYNKKISKD